MNSAAKNNTRYPDEMLELSHINRVVGCIYSFTNLAFCILALVVLCYFVRRRYLLILDIKSVSKDDLIIPDYQNHVKNLKIKSMITNFIIIIVIFEFFYNFSCLVLYSPILTNIFLIFNPVLGVLPFLCFNYLRIISLNCHIAIPCLLMKVLWLTYFHCPYKSTVLRWSVCIAVRCVVSVTLAFLYENKVYSRVRLLASRVLLEKTC